MPEIFKGNQPTDDGNFLFTEEEKNDFIRRYPEAKKLIRPFIGADEFINGYQRYCLWLKDVEPSTWNKNDGVIERVKAVKAFRLKSTKEATRKKAETPYLFDEIRQPKNDYIIIPSVSSENRQYIPIGYEKAKVVPSNLVLVLGSPSLYLLGHLTSAMHMAWVRYVCGRLKSDYRYSKDVVYNNYPWPQAPTEAQRAKVEASAQAVLDARAAHPSATLADLYDPLAMPPDLRAAHTALDRAVDACYRKERFTTELERIQFLFELYRQYTAPLLPAEPAKAKRGRPKGR